MLSVLHPLGGHWPIYCSVTTHLGRRRSRLHADFILFCLFYSVIFSGLSLRWHHDFDFFSLFFTLIGICRQSLPSINRSLSLDISGSPRPHAYCGPCIATNSDERKEKTEKLKVAMPT